MFTPIVLLSIVVAAFIITLVVDRGRRVRRGRALFELARSARMNYSPLDRFDLAGRLRPLPSWLTDATELRVRDVLYAAHGAERRFIATAVRRHARDARPECYVVTCVERLSDGAFREWVPRRCVDQRTATEAYRASLASFGIVAPD